MFGCNLAGFLLIPFLNAEGQYGPAGDGFNPNKKHKPTVLTKNAISDAIMPVMRGAVMVGEAKGKYVIAASKLLSAGFAALSYIVCVECMF